jgi:hypothetical protein
VRKTSTTTAATVRMIHRTWFRVSIIVLIP